MRHIARLFLVTDFTQKSINPKIASSVSCLRRHRFPWHHHDTETESRYVRVDGRPGSSFLLSQPLNPPDGVTASLFTSVASSAPLLTSNQTCSDARYLWIVCVSLIAANHSKYRCACVFSPFRLFPVVGRELQNPHLLVFLSRKMENATDLNSCCCFSAHRQIWAQIPEFMCTESFLQLFPQIESTLRTPCRSGHRCGATTQSSLSLSSLVWYHCCLPPWPISKTPPVADRAESVLSFHAFSWFDSLWLFFIFCLDAAFLSPVWSRAAVNGNLSSSVWTEWIAL